MTPNFSLSLSADGIRLLRRATGGWTLVGEVALDHPDLQGELGRLADLAARLEPGGVRTKLLIPNDQIRYMALDTTRAEDADVRAALDGATPYAVDDLVYDFTKGGGRTYVAAVARETLEEAEAFLGDLDFNPVCFAGVPEPFTFTGEAFFGPTAAAADLLKAGETVERDAEPVTVVGVETLPEAEAEPDLKPEPEPAPVPEAAPEPAPAEPEAPFAEVEEGEETGAADAEDAPEDTKQDEDETDTKQPEAPAEEVVFASRAKPLVADRTVPPAPPKAPTPPKTDAGEPMFASRARPDADAPAKGGEGPDSGQPPLAVPGAEATGPRLTIGAGDADTSAPARPVRTEAPVSKGAPPVAPVAEGAAPAVSPAAIAATMDPVEDEDETTAPKPATDGKPGLFRSRRKAGKRRPAPTPEEPEEEAERLTVFGARKRRKAGPAVGGKPKYLGLILTAILILFLLAVAALATVGTETIARWFGFGDAAVEVAATGGEGDLTAVPVAIPTPAEEFPNLPAPEEEALADVADAEDLLPLTDAAPESTEDLAALDPELAAELDVPETAVMLEPSPVNPGILSPAEAQRRYEATGVWQRAPRLPLTPRVEDTDDVFLAAVDPVSPSTDAIALPAIALSAPDAVIPFPVNPPPADAVFERDARGYILATTVGTRLPDGLIVYAGRPAAVPPARPDIAPTPGDDAAEDPAAEEETVPEGPQVTPGGVSLAGLRPRSRPGDFADTAERDTLGGFTRAELAAFRPRARPDDLAPPPPADAGAIEAALAGAIDPAAEATDLAVAVSVRPDARPRNFDRIVSAARSNPQPAPAAAAPAASAFVAPNGPVPGGVARAATEDNVLRLRDINLIGVSGTSSNRTAIVRLSNGRIEVVRVGDRLDGGRVSAISETALSYVKRGRTITLEMPRG